MKVLIVICGSAVLWASFVRMEQQPPLLTGDSPLDRYLAVIHRCGGDLGWVVTAKCPVVVEEWDFSRITFGHDEGHLVDATISYSARCVGGL